MSIYAHFYPVATEAAAISQSRAVLGAIWALGGDVETKRCWDNDRGAARFDLECRNIDRETVWDVILEFADRGQLSECQFVLVPTSGEYTNGIAIERQEGEL